MPKKITELTEAQKVRMKSYAEEWIKTGLSTERADWPRFEKAVRTCYRYANLNDKVPIIHVTSPIVGAFAAPIAANIIAKIRKNKAKGSAVSSAVDSAVRSAVDSAVDSAVGSAVGSAVDSAVDSAVRSAVDSAVYSAVDSAVDSAVGSAVDSAVGSAVGSAVRSAGTNMWWHYWLGGSLWSAWPSFIKFFFEECGLDLGDINKRAEAYAELSKSAGYWWPNKDFIMVCDRPTKISLDANGILHAEDSMAITWPDGWGLFMWHGARVPAKLIMHPEAITKEEIIKESNSEVSRAYAERLGWEKYFKLAEVVKVNGWLDKKTGLHYELYDFKKRAGERQPRLLRMESPTLNDGTQPIYIEPVHPELKTAEAARKWQFRKQDGSWPEVKECNSNPEMIFAWEA